ncbi:nuclear transport factor 2 family protein [Thiothrix fructosivorans]|uniref:Nuclear transport factor 2 family protein n=1 Tax=Thiothrix fructosivorans TaxID=111770 RepID=A0A8B0SFL4_9GAMM|nr:nuclear transport factor 2 family protein [Thiothrix fructosivorans]MBO0615174.1 nuclear transport factor 2 family protein [Thiothrix fructosivorans]QTX09961.1 nuclear transport factor 2 family protein [Thiothrix fructosivorans]
MDHVSRYLQTFTTLQADKLEGLAEIFEADARFKDPFNDVRGVAAITRIFAHMFATTQHSRFMIVDHALAGDTLFIRWDYHFQTLKGESWEIPGTSVVQFNAEGLAVEHVDYWDPAEHIYSKLPMLGLVMRWLRGKLAVK